jgi:hypothetical protein
MILSRLSLLTLFLAMIAVAPVAPYASAQTLYGTLVGTVKDSSGAMVPDATVTIVQTETKNTRTVTSNSEGAYILSTVPTGTYLITITKEGFKGFEAKDVAVTLNTEVRVDAQLEVGQASQTVSVTADEALLQTDRADVHEQLSSQSLETLPQPTRTYQGLIGLMPGVAPPTAFTGVTNNPMRSMQLHANGTSGSGTLVRIDGVSSQHTRYDVNYGLPGQGAASQPFYNATYGTGITGTETVIHPYESMNYNSLQSTLRHRFREGSNLQVSYTWSRWMGTCCDVNGDGAPNIPIPQYSYLNYAVMPGDRTNNLQIAGIAMLPFGKDKQFMRTGIASAVAGGWQLNAILGFYSGAPFSVSADGTSLNAQGSTQRANQIKSSVAIYKATGNSKLYFDTSAFAPVTTATFGTASYDSLRGPGYGNADVGLFPIVPSP